MNGTRTLRVRFALFLIVGLFSCKVGFAQRGASTTADLGASISVFGGGSYVNPDYGPVNQKGYVFGGDYTRYFHRLYVDPSLEVRALISPKGETVGETVFGGGLKLEHAYSRYHPYVDLLIGSGSIKYVPLGSDNSIVYTYGGGLDVDVIRHFAVKVDVQGSHWHTGGTNYLSPTSVNLAVVYHIPFAARYKN